MDECVFCGGPAPRPVENRGGYVFCSVRCGQEFEAQVAWEAGGGVAYDPVTGSAG